MKLHIVVLILYCFYLYAADTGAVSFVSMLFAYHEAIQQVIQFGFIFFCELFRCIGE